MEIKLGVILVSLCPTLVAYSTYFIGTTKCSEVRNILIQTVVYSQTIDNEANNFLHYFLTKKYPHSKKVIFWRALFLSQNLSWLELLSLGFVDLVSPDQRAFQWKPPASSTWVEPLFVRHTSSDPASTSWVIADSFQLPISARGKHISNPVISGFCPGVYFIRKH